MRSKGGFSLRTVFKRLLCGLLALVLAVGLCPAGLIATAEATPVSANVAYGKSVAFASGSELASDSNYGLSAVKAGLSVLTDGINNSPNWWVNNGNPYIGLNNSVLAGPYIFSVDLGASYDTDKVAIYSYGRSSWNISPVESITYTISADGSSWKTLGTVELADAVVSTIEDPRYPGEYVDIYRFELEVWAAMSGPPSIPTLPAWWASANSRSTAPRPPR